MKCRRCKKDNFDNAIYCIYCGYNLKKKNFSNYLAFSILGVILICYLLNFYQEYYTFSNIKVNEKVIFEHKSKNMDFNYWILDFYYRLNLLKLGNYSFPIWFRKVPLIKNKLTQYNIEYKNNKIYYSYSGSFPLFKSEERTSRFFNNDKMYKFPYEIKNIFYIKNDMYIIGKKGGKHFYLFKNGKIIQSLENMRNYFKYKNDIYYIGLEDYPIKNFYKNIRPISNGKNVNLAFYSEYHNKILLYYDDCLKDLDDKIILDEPFKNEYLIKKTFLPRLIKKNNPDLVLLENINYSNKTNNGKIQYFEIKNDGIVNLCIYGQYLFINRKSQFLERVKKLEPQNLFIISNKNNNLILFSKEKNGILNSRWIDISFQYKDSKFISNDSSKIVNISKDDISKNYIMNFYNITNKNNKFEINSDNSYIFNSKTDKGLKKILDIKKYKSSQFLLLIQNNSGINDLYLNEKLIFSNNKNGKISKIDNKNYAVKYIDETYGYGFYFINGKKEKNSFYQINQIQFSDENDYIYIAQIKDKWHFVLNGEIIERGYDFINYVKYIEEKDSFYAFACDDDKLYLVEIPIKRNEKVTKK